MALDLVANHQLPECLAQVRGPVDLTWGARHYSLRGFIDSIPP
jgi:hypothetical protein